jgi:GNAT superfamily N-acetyltransferase
MGCYEDVMPLVVRRVKVQDLPILEALEREAVRSLPLRPGWLKHFTLMLDRAITEEPEGMLVADADGKAVGMALVRVLGAHPLTGDEHGRLEVLTIAPGWRAHGVAERLLKEAQAYLKSRNCRLMVTLLRSDLGTDAALFKTEGFAVSGWELERAL